MTPKNTIELNGKIYDTVSGKMLKVVGKRQSSKKISPSAKAIHHKADRPHTLMRDIVSPPKLKPRHHIEESLVHMADNRLVLPVINNEKRIERAQSVKQHSLISRFNDTHIRSALIKKTALIAVKTEPTNQIIHHNSRIVTDDPVDPGSVFVNALSTSKNDHKHHPKTKKTSSHKRIFTISSATFSALLLIGFFVFQNAPGAEFRLAASRAGIHASLPSYKPSGFAVNGPTEYAPGQITIRFANNKSKQSYALTQKSSSWNSDGLLENFVSSSSANYQAIKDKGRTVYIYNDNNATWVDGGIWYQIEATAGLNSSQLINIVNSI